MIVKFPNIYKIPANCNFFDELAVGIIEKFSSTSKLKDVTILLPTKLACHTLKETFFNLKKQSPNIHPISDLSELIKLSAHEKPLDRSALLTKITQLLLEMKITNFDNLATVTELAEYFANFLHKTELYQVNLQRLLEIIDENSTIHQQKLVQIFKEFIKIWNHNYKQTTVSYNNNLMENLIDSLDEKIFIIAGVNSNIPLINKLIEQTLLLKNGYLIIYGENVPSYQSNNYWHTAKKTNSDFLLHALAPASSCANWHKLPMMNADYISYLNCADQHEEAKNIINIVKMNLNKSIMIITTDDALMVKIMLHLKALNFDANIVRDYPLNQSRSALWLQLCLNFILDDFSLLSGLALLKHPWALLDPNLELLVRDKNFHSNNIFDAAFEHEKLKISALAFKELFSRKKINFAELLKAHIKFATETAIQDIWQDSVDKELQFYLQQILDNTALLGDISPKDYAQLFNHFLRSGYYREQNNNKAITLTKPIDARLHSADLVILVGLNEGIWPAKPTIDPCFNHAILKKIGFPSVEESIDEETTDFQCFAQGKKVILTRSEKIDGIITVPSRWFLRILTLAKYMNLDLQYKINSNLPITTQTLENSPTPIPVIALRPTTLSVTQIEKLIFNPYHIYVDQILKLKKLPSLTKKLSALDFGNFIHKTIEIYYRNNSNDFLSAGKQALKELQLNQIQIKLLWWPRLTRIAQWFKANENKNNKIYLEIYGKMQIGKNFTLVARADRIEVLPNDSLNIIDYKTGRLPSSKSIYNGQSLQLLLEGVIASEGGFYCQNNPQILNAISYIQLSGGEDLVEILEIDITEKEIIERTKQYLHELIAQYQNPLTPYYYTSKKTTGYCEYAHLARIF